MILSRLLSSIEEKKVSNFHEKEVTGLAYDSRLVREGEAFFCIKGLVTDGHLYADKAVESGARVLVIEREPEHVFDSSVSIVRVPDTRRALALWSSEFYGHPSRSLELVGITGTNGKTTTCYLVERIFQEAGRVTGLIGTVENHVGGRVEQVTRTTPESLDLQKLLRRMVDGGVEVVTMEVSSHALELERVTGCQFDVVVFTNLTQDHLDFHISLEEYFAAKKRLFTLPDFGPERTALINSDDSFGRELLKESVLESHGFGIEADAGVRANDVEVGASGNEFLIVHPNGTMQVKTVLQGRFNVYNCLAAAGVGLVLGADDDSIRKGLEGLKGVPGRFESIDCGQEFTVLVDYAHTPDGIRSLLQACREVSEGRVIIVVGCGGDRDRSKRPLMGKVATQMSDLCVLTSDNPRSEEPIAIIEMMLDGVRGEFEEDRYTVEVERREAIAKAMDRAKAGDLVVIAGKGHESGQVFSDRVVPFNDSEVARECLKEVTGEEC